ncbi:restriction endonuclease subunit S [Spirosoma sp. KUDC1026]|uniref:restriction endonuclease subunit S n=1 Tax=Spirosoma sp. KUDC1026 TaxID=2745947 RepID=UPI00159BD2D6|nr:restriction endonuclease subunit S [Spirosoma sp. KUDC1026]QKZ12714.1 restriction endonuclease subunit S [Spirosoma sp. KUDC1026]
MNLYSNYKPSGIDWIGDIPSHWEIKKLKYAVSKIEEETKQKNFLVAVENIQSRTGKLVGMGEDKTYQGSINSFSKGDVIFNKLRPYLAKVYYACQDGGCLGELLVLRGNHEIDQKYLFYRAISQPFIDIVNSSTEGTKMPRANWDDFIKHLPVALPPLPEQAAIARYLDEKTAQLDTLIDRKRRLIDLLREEKAALINEAVTKGIDPDAPMKDSGIEWLGDIPAHWEVKKLKYISPEISVGLVINPSIYHDPIGTVPMLTGKNVQPYIINLSIVSKITKDSNDALWKSQLFENDIVVVRVGYPGTAAVIPSDLNRSNCASMMIVRRGNFNSHFLCYCFNSKIGRTQVELVEYGATLKQYNISHAIEFVFALPSIEEQNGIIDYLNAESARIDYTVNRIEREIELMQEYRTALISEVVTGKVKVF